MVIEKRSLLCQTGECWAGNSNQHDYAQHGEDNDEGCIGDDYQPCDLENARYCVGHQWRNMVYRIGMLITCNYFRKSLTIIRNFYLMF